MFVFSNVFGVLPKGREVINLAFARTPEFFGVLPKGREVINPRFHRENPEFFGVSDFIGGGITYRSVTLKGDEGRHSEECPTREKNYGR